MTAPDIATCGTCGRSWDYSAHPTPASLCPFCNGDERAATPHEVHPPTTTQGRLAASLDAVERSARTAFAILDEQATDIERAQYAEHAGVELGEVEAEADAALLGGYAFTADHGSPVVAVLAVGGPDIRLMHEGRCHVLVGTLGGVRLERYSPVLNRWGEHIAQQPA